MKNLKKVMYIAQSTGGVERYLYMLLNKIDNKKYENIIVLSKQHDLEKFEGIVDNIEQVDMCREINLINDFKAVLNIRKLIKRYKPDIIYMHSSKAGALARLANIGIKNVTIYNPHGWAFNMRCKKIKRDIYALIERVLAYRTDKIIAISEYEKKSALSKKIGNDKKIEVIYNGIDFDEFENKIEKVDLNIPEESYVIGMVGRISEQKSPDIFVKCAKEIKKNIPNAFFVIVGDGEERKEIEEMIDKASLSNCFIITGWVKNPLDYIKMFDVSMLLSRWEGFGLVLTEYMLAKKPIIATKVDAIPDIISDGKNGILVEIDDYIQASKSVINLFNDKEMYDRLKNNGYLCVKERFNIERVAKETEVLFDSLRK